jgi:hypothetical protein
LRERGDRSAERTPATVAGHLPNAHHGLPKPKLVDQGERLVAFRDRPAAVAPLDRRLEAVGLRWRRNQTPSGLWRVMPSNTVASFWACSRPAVSMTW